MIEAVLLLGPGLVWLAVLPPSLFFLNSCLSGSVEVTHWFQWRKGGRFQSTLAIISTIFIFISVYISTTSAIQVIQTLATGSPTNQLSFLLISAVVSLFFSASILRAVITSNTRFHELERYIYQAKIFRSLGGLHRQVTSDRMKTIEGICWEYRNNHSSLAVSSNLEFRKSILGEAMRWLRDFHRDETEKALAAVDAKRNETGDELLETLTRTANKVARTSKGTWSLYINF